MLAPERTIRIALAGNPNSGKTSVFNLLTGMHQQVGNWPGVTVERKTGRVDYGGYRFIIVDLPGTYSLTAHTLEERIARDYLLDERPDVVVNVVDSSNLERHLYLTSQLLEMGVDTILDLNMWDEFQNSGARLDLARCAALLGTPVVTTVAARGEGREALLDAAILLIERRSAEHRHIPVTFGAHLESALVDLAQRIEAAPEPDPDLPARYLATKLLEGDSTIVGRIHNRRPSLRPLLGEIESRRQAIQLAARREPALLIAEGRRGFIAGLLREVRHAPSVDRMESSRRLDRVLTHRYLGLPIFAACMWLLFNATFVLGAYPQRLLEAGVAFLAAAGERWLPAGFATELLVDGVIRGVGAVAVFLPNILLLFLGVAVLEDSGYMARSAFIMDRVMHLFGLHGKSFIPMLMGFGCSVPAIMATRTLESRRDRILTALVLPHMSCSARLPVYVLFAGAFFERRAGNVVALVYVLGVIAAMLMGRLFSATLFRHERAAFVMELPPYRWPTARGLLTHMWERARHYLKRMGGVILLASMLLWVLTHWPAVPRVSGHEASAAAVVEHSALGRLGRVIAPVVAPLGFPWPMGVTLVSGFAAKEVMISSLSVLYQPGGEVDAGTRLSAALRAPQHGLSPLVAFAFMIFVLLYTPCVAAVLAIRREFGSVWMVVDVAYQLALAWLAAFAVFQGGRLLGLG